MRIEAFGEVLWTKKELIQEVEFVHRLNKNMCQKLSSP